MLENDNQSEDKLSDKPYKILFFGFSVTAEKSGYVDRTRETFFSRHGNSVELIRVGLGGLQPYHARYLFPSILRNVCPDMVVMDISTSAFREYSQFYPKEDHAITVMSLIAVSRKYGCSSVVIDFFRSDVDYADDWVSKLHRTLCIKLEVPYLNIALEILRDTGLRDGFLKDIVHTTPKGCDYYATRVSNYLFELMDNLHSSRGNGDDTVMDIFSSSFDSVCCVSLAASGKPFETFDYERTGYAVTMVEVAEGQSFEMYLPEVKNVCGFSYMMYPLSGYVNYSYDDVHIGRFSAYDMHSYYPRLGASVFVPRKAQKVVLHQLEEIPTVKLLKGAENNGARIGRFGHVFVQGHDKQTLKECVRDFWVVSEIG